MAYLWLSGWNKFCEPMEFSLSQDFKNPKVTECVTGVYKNAKGDRTTLTSVSHISKAEHKAMRLQEPAWDTKKHALPKDKEYALDGHPRDPKAVPKAVPKE